MSNPSTLQDCMNCSAGLVLLTVLPSDEPKTRNMETQQLWISTRNDERTELFRILFQVSVELENYRQYDSDLGYWVNTIIEALDLCMDLILQEAIKKKY